MSTFQYPRNSALTKPQKIVPTDCYRCGGSGGHVQWPGFTCFRCGGDGVDPSYREWAVPASWTDEQVAEWDTARLARNEKARVRAAEKRLAKQYETFDANVIATPALLSLDLWIRENGWTGDGFLNDLRSKAFRFPLSEKQSAALTKAWVEFLAKLEAKAAAKAEEDLLPDLPEGTYDMVGTIVTKKYVENQWGGQLKMLVALESGHRVWGTAPKALRAKVGDKVAFTATVTRSDDDRLFGFYSRPRSAVTLEEAADDDGADATE